MFTDVLERDSLYLNASNDRPQRLGVSNQAEKVQDDGAARALLLSCSLDRIAQILFQSLLLRSADRVQYDRNFVRADIETISWRRAMLDYCRARYSNPV